LETSPQTHAIYATQTAELAQRKKSALLAKINFYLFPDAELIALSLTSIILRIDLVLRIAPKLKPLESNT